MVSMEGVNKYRFFRTFLKASIILQESIFAQVYELIPFCPYFPGGTVLCTLSHSIQNREVFDF